MTTAELLALGAFIVSGLAAVDSVRTRRGQPALIREQLREYREARRAEQRADIRIRLERQSRTAKFVIFNCGGAPGMDIDVQISRADGSDALMPDDRRERVPIPRLDPNGEIRLQCLISSQRRPPFDALLTWTNPDGSEGKHRIQLSL